MKYIVDPCILNNFLDGSLRIETLPRDGDYVASHIQVDEINNTKYAERRAKLLLLFTETVKEILPTESAIAGIYRAGYCKAGDGIICSKIKNDLDLMNGGKENNMRDALIVEISINNRFTLLTADFDLQEVAKRNGCNMIYWKT